MTSGQGFVDLHDVLKELRVRHPGGTHIAAAVDGSTMSDRAAQVAVRFVENKREDTFTALHVSDRTKVHLPKNLLPQHLKTHYKDMADNARIPMEWVCRDKAEGQSTCEALTKLASKHKIDLLVLGSFGRKGEKLELLGSVSDFSLRESASSICIVRSTGSKFDKQAKFLFSTDGSHAAALAFCTLVKSLKRPADIVNVVMISTTDGSNEQATIDHYHDFMVEHKIIGDAFVKCIDRTSQVVYEGILDAVSETESDILVLGISGYGQKKLGSVSERISTNASCTTIIIKDSYEVMSKYNSAGSASAFIAGRH